VYFRMSKQNKLFTFGIIHLLRKKITKDCLCILFIVLYIICINIFPIHLKSTLMSRNLVVRPQFWNIQSLILFEKFNFFLVEQKCVFCRCGLRAFMTFTTLDRTNMFKKIKFEITKFKSTKLERVCIKKFSSWESS
jgi:hypothetical protein